MILSFVLTIILFVCVAMLVREGLWSNAITLFNAIFAGLLATSLWEPVAGWLDDQFPRGTYVWDFVALWVVFCASAALLRALTDLVSRTRVRFKKPVEWTGGIILALAVGWVMVCFVSMTLHTAPLAQQFMRGNFYDVPEDNIFWGIAAPDRQWLGLIQQVSRATLSGPSAAGGGTRNVFDPQGQFIPQYAKRRAEYEQVKGIIME